jgi:hypothetical protein
MSIYAIPSFINLVIKLWLFWFGRDSLISKNRCLGALLLAFFSLNLAEFLSFHCIDNAHYTYLVVKYYWVSAVFSAAIMLMLSDQLTCQRIPSGLFTATAIILSYLIIATDTLIAGGVSIDYTVTRIPGVCYWILQLYVLTCVTGSAVLLAYGGRNLPDKQQRRKCTIVFLGFIPIVLSVIVVFAFMQAGIRMNAVMIISTAITFFLAVLITTEVRYSLLNLLTSTPVISVHMVRQVVSLMYEICRNRSFNLKYFLQKIENILIIAVLDINNGDRRGTAKQLGMHISSLNKKLQKIHEGCDNKR